MTTDGYFEPLGRCESCGQLVRENELISLSWRGSPETLICDDCYSFTAQCGDEPLGLRQLGTQPL